jgi:hypothetical protein
VLKETTLQELQALVSFSEFVDVITMQVILHTTKAKPKDMRQVGRFTCRCRSKFSSLLDRTNERSIMATKRLMACDEYETRATMEGLGGCVVKSLKELLDAYITEKDD